VVVGLQETGRIITTKSDGELCLSAITIPLKTTCN
jgi:hypothetical protein